MLRSTGGPGVTVGRPSQRRWASEDKKNGNEDKPFYLQLNESIYERIQREKAEQQRMQIVQRRTGRGQFFGFVFGIVPSPLPVSGRPHRQ